MITRDKLVEIGSFNKPHGINGEISATFLCEGDDVDNLSSIILNIDGIYVPFFLENHRQKNYHTSLIKFDGINSDIEVRQFVGKTIYALKDEFEEIEAEEHEAAFYIGFSIIDNDKTIGKIVGIDDSTENYLFIVDCNGEELLIPITMDFIEGIDVEKKKIIMSLPKGLFDL